MVKIKSANIEKRDEKVRLVPNPEHWSDTDVLRALLAQGEDAVGKLLVGNQARDRFVATAALFRSTARLPIRLALPQERPPAMCLAPR